VDLHRRPRHLHCRSAIRAGTRRWLRHIALPRDARAGQLWRAGDASTGGRDRRGLLDGTARPVELSRRAGYHHQFRGTIMEERNRVRGIAHEEHVARLSVLRTRSPRHRRPRSRAAGGSRHRRRRHRADGQPEGVTDMSFTVSSADGHRGSGPRFAVTLRPAPLSAAPSAPACSRRRWCRRDKDRLGRDGLMQPASMALATSVRSFPGAGEHPLGNRGRG